MSPRRQDPHKEKLVPLIVRLPEDVHAGLAQLAAEEDRSLNATIIRACREVLERRRKRR